MIGWGPAGVGFSNIFHLGCFILLWVLSEKRKLRQFIRYDYKEKRFFRLNLQLHQFRFTEFSHLERFIKKHLSFVSTRRFLILAFNGQSREVWLC